MGWLEETTQSYRRGFVEGQAGELDTYLLLSGDMGDIEEYMRGFEDGQKTTEAQPEDQ